MSSIWTNLLFMHGHIADLELARRLADTQGPSERPQGKRRRTPKAVPARKGDPSPALVKQGGCLTT